MSNITRDLRGIFEISNGLSTDLIRHQIWHQPEEVEEAIDLSLKNLGLEYGEFTDSISDTSDNQF